jgi:hypothetical protein
MSKGKRGIKKLRAPKVQQPSVKIVLEDMDSQALKYLRNFQDFQGKSNASIFRTALRIVAVDAANKMAEIQQAAAKAEGE